MGPMSGLTEVHKIQLPILQAYAPLGLFCAEEFQISFTPRLYDCFFPPLCEYTKRVQWESLKTVP